MSEKFKYLRFKVHSLPPGEELLLRFPDLKSLGSFSAYKKGDRNRIIRYIMYFYDPNSELIEDIQDHRKRQEAAAEEAGIVRKPSGKFADDVVDMFDMKNEEVNEMIFDFLKIIDDKTWTILKVNEMNFWELTRLIADPIDGKDSKTILEAAEKKRKLREELKAIVADIETYSKKMFGDSEQLQAKAKKKLRAITPENVMHS